MDTAELKILNVLIEKLHLTDEEKINFTEDFEKVRENRLKSSREEFKSLFDEGFHRIELKLEQQNTNFEKFKAEINSKFGENKAELYSKLEENKAELYSKLEENKENLYSKLEENKENLYSKLEENKENLYSKLEQQNTKFEQFNEKLDKHRWEIIKLFITIVLMILGLYATVIFKN